MTVKELMEILGKTDPKALVVIEMTENDGCGTCGWGATRDEVDIGQVHDNEARVVIVPD